MILQVRHQTQYIYTLPVSQVVNQVCLLPRSTLMQRCQSARIAVSPEPRHIDIRPDHYGNSVARYGIDQPHKVSTITVNSIIETVDESAELPTSLTITENRQRLRKQIHPDALMAHDCQLPSPYVGLGKITDSLCNTPTESATVLGTAQALMQLIYNEFEYDPHFSTLITPISDIISARKGVCQDFAHLAIATLRRLGIPARYVSGYLETLPPPGKPKLQGADASHAWFSVFDCATGWHDFDPTNGKRPDSQYVTTAWGRDYADVTPIKGVVYGGGKHELSVEVDVNRLTSVD